MMKLALVLLYTLGVSFLGAGTALLLARGQIRRIVRDEVAAHTGTPNTGPTPSAPRPSRPYRGQVAQPHRRPCPAPQYQPGIASLPDGDTETTAPLWMPLNQDGPR